MSRAHVRADQLEEEIACLRTLEADALKTRWTDLYGMEPPPKIRRDLLVRAIAYRLQERVHGGLSASARLHLREVAVQARGTGNKAAALPGLAPGSRLVREWGGSVHEVTALESGFDYRSRRYGSLSEIAREITGTRWNGRLFFGLTSRRKDAKGRGGEGA